MATTLKIVAGNTAPPWQITCERDNTPINLSGCAVFVIIAKGSTITQPGGLCTIINTIGGVVEYIPQSGDCPTSGTYKVDVKIQYADLTTEVIYEQLKVKVRKPLV